MATQAVFPQPTNPQPKQSILEKSHFLLIARSFISRAKTISSSQLDMQVKVDQSALHHQKELFNCLELRAIASLDVHVDNFVKLHSLPFPTHKGIYILPKMMFQEVENFLMEQSEKRKELVEAFCSVYDLRVLDARQRLGDLFNAADYPTKEEARQAFKFTWSYKNFGVAENLEEISKEVAAREHQKFQSEIEDAGLAIQQMMRTTMQGLVSHLADRLAPGENGKKKVLRSSAVDSLTEFLTTFPALNLANDQELAALVQKAKAITSGITPDALRSNDALRDSMQKQFAEIKTNLDKLVQEQPMRGFNFEE